MVQSSRATAVRRAGAFLALVAFELGAVVVLHRLGDLPWLRVPFDDLGGWLQTSAPEDVLAAVVRLVALGAAWWLLGGTALYVLARLSRIPGAIRALERVTLPSVRRIADQAIALTLATSIISGGANAALASPAGIPSRPDAVVATHDPLTAWTRASRSTPGATGRPAYQPQAAGDREAGYRPQAAGHGEPGRPPEAAGGAPGTTRPRAPAAPRYTPSPAGPPRRPARPPQAPPGEAGLHRVAPGDNLWTIARDRLAEVTGRPAAELGEREVARYWLEVVDANRATLRSGDPDLIFPGETIKLPPPTRPER
jgi:nucleoid-associated protein YgaU